MDALILDFDGVVVDSEPLHYECFRQVLAGEGIELSRDEYYASYLGMDDFDCFTRVMEKHGRPCSQQTVFELITKKTYCVQGLYAREIKAMPGAVNLAEQACLAVIPTAICSGGLRQEIELAAGAIGVRQHIMTIVSAEDVHQGKPSPEGYRIAHERLCQLSGRVLMAGRMIVIEDSPAGIEAAKGAGMKVVGLTSSYTADKLADADLVVTTLEGLTIKELDKLLR